MATSLRLSSRTGLRTLLLTAPFVLAGWALPAQADVYSLRDGNSTARISIDTPVAWNDWVVDGRDVVVRNGFWYRVGATGGEQPFDSLYRVSSLLTDRNGDGYNDGLQVVYRENNTPGSRFTVTLDYDLIGHTPGDGISNMQVLATVYNDSASSLSFHLFDYADFDLEVTGLDTLTITGRNTAVQTNGSLWRVVGTITPRATQALATDSPAGLLAALNDGNPTELGTTQVGPVSGDVAWGFQWDRSIAPGGAMLASHNYTVAVPEPVTLCLLAVGAGSMLTGAAVRRRRAVN